MPDVVAMCDVHAPNSWFQQCNLHLAGEQASCLCGGIQAAASLFCYSLLSVLPGTSSVDLIAEACSMYRRSMSNASFVHGRFLDGSVAGEQLATAECIARSDGQTYPKHQ